MSKKDKVVVSTAITYSKRIINCQYCEGKAELEIILPGRLHAVLRLCKNCFNLIKYRSLGKPFTLEVTADIDTYGKVVGNKDASN